jgi:D-amino-acid dehydrogenase
MLDVIVIGGGIVGVSAAYRLARGGVSVTLIDRADAGQATAAGAGIIAPGTTYKSPAPFYPLAFQAVAYYEELLGYLAEDGETEIGYEVAGLLHVATSDDEAAHLPDLLRLMAERHAAGVRNIGEVRQIDGQEARMLFPALGQVSGALYAPGAARVDGRLLRDAMRRAAGRRGARILAGNAELARQDGQRVQVSVNGERLSAAALILAGGAWSEAFGEALRLRLPVYPQRGQIVHLELPKSETGRWPIVVGFHSHYLLAFPTHRVVAGATREDGVGFDARLTASGVHEVVSEALRVAPGLSGASLREMRVGLRPSSPDGLPLLGRAPGFEQVWLATGHGPSGLQLGPYSGALIVDMLLGAAPPLDLSAFAPERFQS